MASLMPLLAAQRPMHHPKPAELELAPMIQPHDQSNELAIVEDEGWVTGMAEYGAEEGAMMRDDTWRWMAKKIAMQIVRGAPSEEEVDGRHMLMMLQNKVPDHWIFQDLDMPSPDKMAMLVMARLVHYVTFRLHPDVCVVSCPAHLSSHAVRVKDQQDRLTLERMTFAPQVWNCSICMGWFDSTIQGCPRCALKRRS